MAEGTRSDMEDGDFEELMLESDVRGYLYEPQYSDEQLRPIDEQEAAMAAAAATAEAEDLPVVDEEPGIAQAKVDWWCLCSHCAPMDTEIESVCCREFQRCQFLLDEISESEEDTDVCVVEHPSFAPHMDSGVLETYFRIPKAIRLKYPASDGQYCRHQEAEDAQEVLRCLTESAGERRAPRAESRSRIFPSDVNDLLWDSRFHRGRRTPKSSKPVQSDGKRARFSRNTLRLESESCAVLLGR
ncbi:hypothetical protein N1851_012112 [Merluccius polli]|uniref:P2X purinoceptor 7-like n=1 Tax=Merluccius polli TaxID=89951 RepID=A0AA47MWV0_MERPO|nr:hypothetical protein N1851_012112 [Merluccius polli]